MRKKTKKNLTVVSVNTPSVFYHAGETFPGFSILASADNRPYFFNCSFEKTKYGSVIISYTSKQGFPKVVEHYPSSILQILYNIKNEKP